MEFIKPRKNDRVGRKLVSSCSSYLLALKFSFAGSYGRHFGDALKQNDYH